jgi:hypothetical protein
MKLYFILILLATVHYSLAQVSSPSAMSDTTTALPPGTVRIKAKVLSADNMQATVQVISLVGSGQGIVNPPTEGQKIIIRLPEGRKKMGKGKIIQMDLKEKMGVDASQSSFSLLRSNE